MVTSVLNESRIRHHRFIEIGRLVRVSDTGSVVLVTGINRSPDMFSGVYVYPGKGSTNIVGHSSDTLVVRLFEPFYGSVILTED